MGEEIILGQTLFDVPTEPQEFGVALPPAQLRSLDFSALDFQTLRRAGIEYVRTYFPDDFNDFVASNGVIMFLELVSYIGNVLSERMDILVDESFLSTAQTEEAVSQHLALIDQKIRGATPATVDIEITIPVPVATELRIQPGLVYTLRGGDNKVLFYELFRAPDDFINPIVIPPGKQGIVAFGIEGRFSDAAAFTASGGAGQFVDIIDNNILENPIVVSVSSGDFIIQWTQVDIIERSGPNDEVFEVQFLDDRMRIKFGDNVNGKAPIAGQQISTRYRIGGGIRGRLGANIISESRQISPQAPTNATIEVNFRNPLPSSGGRNKETIEEAKRRAPREFATHNSAITGEDYDFLSSLFSHPVFGSVLKAVAILRTGIEVDEIDLVRAIRAADTEEEAADILLTNYVNRNIVELYVLSEGPDGPVLPSAGLKTGLRSFFEDIKVLTDEVRVFDGAIKPVDVEATIVMSRSADAGTIKETVTNAIINFFNIANFDMGEGLHKSNLYEEIQNVPGVQFVNIFEPQDNILPTQKPGGATSETGVGFNELIVLGNLDLRFFFEQGSQAQ
jgi:hypothetical protein